MSTGKGELKYAASTTVAEFRLAAAAVAAQGTTGQSPKDALLLHAPSGALGQVQQPDPGVAPLIYSMGIDLTQYVTDADLHGARGQAVKIAASGVITLCSVDGEAALGVLVWVDGSAVGSPCVVRAFGEARILSGSGITRMQRLKVTTTGAYDPAAAGDIVVALALEDIAGGSYGRALITYSAYLIA